MSFDIFVQRFQRGQAAHFPKIWLEHAFEAHVTKREPTWGMTLSYPDGGGGDLYFKGEEIHGFTINRPGGRQLFNDLYGLMQKAELVAYWPSCMIMPDISLATHLPEDMLATLGPAKSVSSGEDIVLAIKEA